VGVGRSAEARRDGKVPEKKGGKRSKTVWGPDTISSTRGCSGSTENCAKMDTAGDKKREEKRRKKSGGMV